MAKLGEAFDLDSFDEVEATPAPSDPLMQESAEDGEKAGKKPSAGDDRVTEIAALKECEDAIAKSEDLCQRLDPEEEPYRSKYLAREALRIAMSKIAPYANLQRKSTNRSSGSGRPSTSYLAAGPGGSETAKVTAARIEWRLGAICMEVEELGAAEAHLMAALKQWRPRVVETLSQMELPTYGGEEGPKRSSSEEERAAAGAGSDERELMISELVEYCREKQREEARRAQKRTMKLSGAGAAAPVSYALEVIDAMSHLGIYHHNFEHFEQGLVLLRLCEELIKDLSGVDSHLMKKRGAMKSSERAAVEPGETTAAAAEEEEEKKKEEEKDGDKERVLTPLEWAAAEEEAKALSVHTHVLFYLAQAFAALGEPHEGARYCQATLELQLVQEESNQRMRRMRDLMRRRYEQRVSSGTENGSSSSLLPAAAPSARQQSRLQQPEGNMSSDPFSTASHRPTWSMSAGSAAGKGYGSVLDAKEWYQNCSGLVAYFTGQGRYRDAEHCLLACDAIVEQYMAVPGPPATPRNMAAARERLDEARADMHRRWGVLYLNVLTDAARYREAALRLVADGEATVEEARIGQVDPDRMAEEPPLTIDFRPLGIVPPPPLPAGAAAQPYGQVAAAAAGGGEQKKQKQKRKAAPLPAEVVDFESARAVFKLATARHAKAKKFYVLDGFVTDHVALCRDVSSMYRSLGTFEADEKRKTAMYLRRVQELKPVAKELGRQAYLDTIRALTFEIGEIWMEMCEMKQERLSKKQAANPAYRPKDAEVAKSNEYCNSSIDAFIEFTELFRKQPPPNPLFPLAAEEKKKKGGEEDETDSDDSDDGLVVDGKSTEKMSAKEREEARAASEKRRAARKAAKKAKKKEKEFPLEIEPADLGVHLRAHFYVARMYGKLLPMSQDTAEGRVQGLRNSLKKYQWLKTFSRERIAALPRPRDKGEAATAAALSLVQGDEPFTDPGTVFKDELPMVDQMCELLPKQIDRVFHTGKL